MKKKVSSQYTFVYGFSSNCFNVLAVKVEKVKQEIVYKFSKLINNDFFVLYKFESHGYSNKYSKS